MASEKVLSNPPCVCGHGQAMHFSQRHECLAWEGSEVDHNSGMRVLGTGQRCACHGFTPR